MPAPRRTLLFALGCLACLAARAPAQVSTPGSLLLYPEYDSESGTGIINLITVTNTDGDGPAGVDTEWNYVNGATCVRVNLFVDLGPGDTFTTITRSHNPFPGHGYLYVVAIDPGFGPARVHNHLIGTSTVLNGIHAFDYTIQPLAFEGIGDGQHTDLDGDGKQDLDGREYTRVADQVVIPRFYGQDFIKSRLIMIDLTGGAGWQTDLQFLIHNDNSQQFSAQHSFECWKEVDLLDISGVFGNDFLANNTNHDPLEIYGVPSQESGWILVDGGQTTNGSTVIDDPAFTCLLIEEYPYTLWSAHSQVTVSPTAVGRQNNGDLPPSGESRQRP